MFNRKLKRKVEELELKIWRLENPCPVKIGDKYKGGKVFSIEFKKAKELSLYDPPIFLYEYRNHWKVKTIKKDKINTYHL